MVDRNETDDDAVLIIDGTQIPVTSFTKNRVSNSAESKYNDSRNPYTGLTSYYFEGSFEWDGSIPRARSALSNPDGSPATADSIIARGVDGGWQFGRITPQGNEWSFESESKTSSSQDWKADTGSPL